MKRFIKINNMWIDTLLQQKQGYYYYTMDNKVYCFTSNSEEDKEIGVLENESDIQLRNDPIEFLKLNPTAGYTKYSDWCVGKPISKKKFRKLKGETL